MSTDASEFDENGSWTGTCAKCGTDHDGYHPDTLSGITVCLRAQAASLGATHLVERLDVFDTRRSDTIRRVAEAVGGQGAADVLRQASGSVAVRDVIADWLRARGFDREYHAADDLIAALGKAGLLVPAPGTATGATRPTPWPATPPEGAPRAGDLIADVLHDAFKGDTDVDLDLLAAQTVDALMGDRLTVELRWYDGMYGVGEGVVVLAEEAAA